MFALHVPENPHPCCEMLEKSLAISCDLVMASSASEESPFPNLGVGTIEEWLNERCVIWQAGTFCL